MSSAAGNTVSSSDISSDSEDEAPIAKITTPVPSKIAVPVPTMDDPFRDTNEQIDLIRANANTQKAKTPGNTSTPPKRKLTVRERKQQKKRKLDLEPEVERVDPFKNPNPTTPTTKAIKNTNPTKTAPKAKTPKSNKKAKTQAHTSVVSHSSSVSFRDLALPIASFSVESAAPITPKSKMVAEAPPTPTPLEPKHTVPKSTPEGIKWQKAVLATRENPRYDSDFDFDRAKSNKNNFVIPGDWFKAKSYGAWCANNPHAIAIDCEMCLTEDPVSKAQNHKALCRLSVVNASNPDEVLIDTLVKPLWPVKDYRSKINGIKKEDLEGVEFTIAHAQAFMKALCSRETVIIGHAVHNDLIALRMEHHCNADSAQLFPVMDEENATCSLKDLAMGVLKREMPDVHDSVNDARVACLCLEQGWLKTNGKPEPIVRTQKKRSGVDLFVHRIPKGCFPEHLENMFLKHTSIKPAEISPIEFNSDTGKTLAVFTTADHANLAFNSISGEAKPDKTGRLQKRVYLKTGGYICIRKNSSSKRRRLSK